MSPSSQLITDICRELGLICTITKAARERELNPNVWASYKTLDDVTYAYRNDDSDIIHREVVAIGRLSNLCLAVYAAKVWSANENERAGVLKAGDWRANGLYPKDLFWDDPEDRKFIKDKFRELAVEKAIRYSALLAGEGVEDDEDSMDDPTYCPTSTTPNARSTTGKRAVSSAQIKPDSWSCFSTTTDVEKGHQDASMLKELGVWLGSAEAPDEVLTELSFNEVIKDFYFATNCGTEKLENTEPKTNAHHWPNPSTTLACGACFHQGRATEEGMSTQDIKFQYKDMRRLASI